MTTFELINRNTPCLNGEICGVCHEEISPHNREKPVVGHLLKEKYGHMLHQACLFKLLSDNLPQQCPTCSEPIELGELNATYLQFKKTVLPQPNSPEEAANPELLGMRMQLCADGAPRYSLSETVHDIRAIWENEKDGFQRTNRITTVMLSYVAAKLTDLYS